MGFKLADHFKSLKGRVIAVLRKVPLPDVFSASPMSTPLNTLSSWPEHHALAMFQGNSGFTIMGGQFNNVWGNLQVITGPPVAPALTIIDAAGRSFLFPAEIPVGLESVRGYLELLLHHRKEAVSDILLEFVREGQYSLSIDEGRQVTMLGSGEEQWARVVPGTKIVMSVILQQKKRGDFVGYECPICQTWNGSQGLELSMAGDW
uniref:Ubiquitin-like domain-containing protein n=1 Tax=Moniliophthora roreri TaxID=221103 RepID=A0A0W0FC01_MONRR